MAIKMNWKTLINYPILRGERGFLQKQEQKWQIRCDWLELQ